MAESEGVWHRVCLNTIVRSGKNLDSERLRILPMGSRVMVVETDGRRVRITSPIKGWCSKKSSNGDDILKEIQSDPSVPETPKSSGGTIKSLKDRKQKAEKMLDEADGPNFKGKVDKEGLKEEAEMLKKRLDEANKTIALRNAELARTMSSSKEAENQLGSFVIFKSGFEDGIGVIRWVRDDKLGIEVEKGTGNMNGIVDGAKLFQVEPDCGMLISKSDVQKTLHPMAILKSLDDLTEQFKAWRTKYNELAAFVGHEGMAKFEGLAHSVGITD